jgi:hypothetical protein
MFGHGAMRLGRRAKKTDSRTLKLADYLSAGVDPAPPARDWTGGQLEWGMMMNDQLGDCTIAGAGHALQVWSKNAGSEFALPDEVIEQTYSAWDGYVPGNPLTDHGGIELDVLNKWRQGGLAGHALKAFASIAAGNLDELRQAINLFGGAYIGLSLPLTARKQQVWDIDPSGGPQAQEGSWGGHCVFVAGYDESSFTCITWGSLKTITNAFMLTYCDEAYALFGQDWLNTGGQAPSGFNEAQLDADLAQIH